MRLSLKRQEILSIIAHYELLVGAEKHVKLPGLAKHFTDAQRGQARALLEEYVQVRNQTSQAIADLMEGKTK